MHGLIVMMMRRSTLQLGRCQAALRVRAAQLSHLLTSAPLQTVTEQQPRQCRQH